MQPIFGDMFDQARLKASGDALMKGIREMQDTASATTKARAEEVAEFWKAFFSIGSMEDVQKLQAHVKQAIEKSVGDTQKAALSFTSLVENTMKPLKPAD